MRLHLCSLVAGVLLLAATTAARAQAPAAPDPDGSLPPQHTALRSAMPPATGQLELCLQQMAALRQAEATLQAGAQDDEQKKKIELLQKQIDTLEKITNLLSEQLKKQPPAGLAVETLQARSVQAARRDVVLANAVDDVNDHVDALQRVEPWLPAPLKELFLPSGANESPLSIYGQIGANYHVFPHRPGAGEFEFEEFAPFFLVKLNDWILLEAELEITSGGIGVSQGQVDFLVNDCLTVVAGRFLSPVGFFTERLHPLWINKLPDFPLYLGQVSPVDYSFNGLQTRGAFYLGCLPVKAEYSLFVANGFGLPAGAGVQDVSDLEAIVGSTGDVNEAMAYGGRVGLWYPALGLAGGVSALFNSPYTPAAGPTMEFWDIDLNFHRGNWDVRVEGGSNRQGTAGVTDQHIHRWGYYAQVAYRPYDACCWLLANTELVARYSRARFSGIDPTAIDLTAFDTPVHAPVDRDQYTFGINYYFYPSMVVKFAYEINHERHGVDLHDSQFIAQIAWGF